MKRLLWVFIGDGESYMTTSVTRLRSEFKRGHMGHWHNRVCTNPPFQTAEQYCRTVFQLSALLATLSCTIVDSRSEASDTIVTAIRCCRKLDVRASSFDRISSSVESSCCQGARRHPNIVARFVCACRRTSSDFGGRVWHRIRPVHRIVW